MAIPFDKSSRLPGTRTPMSDSALVRTRWPSWPLMPGSEPFSFSRKSRSRVPNAEAANTLRQVLAAAGHAHPDERLGVGSHPVAQLAADARKRAFFFQPEEQVQGAQCRGREHHARS